MRRHHALFCSLLWLAPAASAFATPPPDHKLSADAKIDKPLIPRELTTDEELAQALREHYTKFEYRIPMRDGVRLFTHVYVPKDHSQRYPILMMRTPYGIAPYGIDNYPSAKQQRAAHSRAQGQHQRVGDTPGGARGRGLFSFVRLPKPTEYKECLQHGFYW